jgi:hypothetical protein
MRRIHIIFAFFLGLIFFRTMSDMASNILSMAFSFLSFYLSDRLIISLYSFMLFFRPHPSNLDVILLHKALKPGIS